MQGPYKQHVPREPRWRIVTPLVDDIEKAEYEKVLELVKEDSTKLHQEFASYIFGELAEVP